MPEILNILINNGIGVACAAAVLWFSWYRETKTIPGLLKTFESAHQHSMDTLKKMQEEMQTAFAERSSRSLDVFTQLVREERTNYQRWHEENRQRLDAMSEEVRNNRHLIKNIAHQLGLKQAMEKQLAEVKKGEQL